MDPKYTTFSSLVDVGLQTFHCHFLLPEQFKYLETLSHQLTQLASPLQLLLQISPSYMLGKLLLSWQPRIRFEEKIKLIELPLSWYYAKGLYPAFDIQPGKLFNKVSTIVESEYKILSMYSHKVSKIKIPNHLV